VVRLTPVGRGAVATVLIEGPRAAQRVAANFRSTSGRPLGEHPADRPVFGHFGPPPGEEVVVRCRGRHSIELHCHGGHAAAALIEDTLVESACRVVAWRDWTAGRHPDPITAAARQALSEAPTQRTAAILLDQYHGALRRALSEIEQSLDQGDFDTAVEQIETLLGRADLGRRLTRPWKVVLAGRPNAGKSSLINRLVGFRRAIVHETPGTTRDVLTASTAVDGWPVELADTAGIAAHAQGLERAGIDLAQRRLAAADLIVLVFDRSRRWSIEDDELVAAWPSALIVHNKADLAEPDGGRPAGLVTCALCGSRVEALADAIAARLVPSPPPPGAAVPFTGEVLDRLGELAQGCGGI